ncbi:hypothetical protein F4556_003020 [Kitasatospora gansuensis]|uniref:Uncharacterized protein n=1 Tax=Kitasatospora gansuensis TaxID=258050 RepID=A0A7W7SBL3_9ACTN|nr:hypothetical protein [Kitasatospora gansuensis]MBB4947485.1 hypothetical protein [Kitasatospora gansuensis]
MTAAFELSYRALSEEQARLFRLTSLHPGPDFSTETTAEWYDGNATKANQLLQALGAVLEGRPA